MQGTQVQNRPTVSIGTLGTNLTIQPGFVYFVINEFSPNYTHTRQHGRDYVSPTIDAGKCSGTFKIAKTENYKLSSNLLSWTQNNVSMPRVWQVLNAQRIVDSDEISFSAILNMATVELQQLSFNTEESNDDNNYVFNFSASLEKILNNN